MAKKFSIPIWIYLILSLVALWFVLSPMVSSGMGCPGSQVYCPGVGCVSGQDKCFPGAKGGASRTFSETFANGWPGMGIHSQPPEYGKEEFVNKQCPDGSRTDGPCLLEF